MNKKVNKSDVKNGYLFDDKEDLEIRNVAYSNPKSSKLLLVILILVFFAVLSITLCYIKHYYQLENNKNSEVIEIKNDKNDVLITNNGYLNKIINNKIFENENEDLVIEQINSITLSTEKTAKENGEIYFNVQYDILENDFSKNMYASDNSNVLVKFFYSYDLEEWMEVNNAISTIESNLNPIMGNYYDVAGIKTNIKIATNHSFSVKPGENKTMYWKIETKFKKLDIDNDKKFIANFKIDYNDNN